MRKRTTKEKRKKIRERHGISRIMIQKTANKMIYNAFYKV